jgi:predicted DNA-binding protein (UPF0251 family)
LPLDSVSQKQAATMMNVSERAVRAVKKIMRDAPEKIAEIEKYFLPGLEKH